MVIVSQLTVVFCDNDSRKFVELGFVDSLCVARDDRVVRVEVRLENNSDKMGRGY